MKKEVKKHQSNKFKHYMLAPIRILKKARQFYIKRVVECAGGRGYGAAGDGDGAVNPVLVHHISHLPKAAKTTDNNNNSLNLNCLRTSGDEMRVVVNKQRQPLLMMEIEIEVMEEVADRSSIGQSVLMALTVTVNKYYASSNLQAVRRRHGKAANPSTNLNFELGRRGLILSTIVATTQEPDSRTELLKKYLKKSKENKEKYDKERLESYYKRNYKDYFESMEGTLNGKDGQLSETEKGIRDWIQSNK
ncbi:hypothetical protein RIF29_22754 [Crotalaria pallida]|uniref:Uncharacterized protein n=1 Tax=Crotalaria pallida TaxID=3830 RepID=A0AAN9F500_CROPI